MVALFAEQNAHVELSISFYDTTRNKDAELRRQKMEQEEKYIGICSAITCSLRRQGGPTAPRGNVAGLHGTVLDAAD